MKYLITGSSGFWGLNLVNHILKKEEDPEIICVYKHNNNCLKNLQVKTVQCCLENKNEVNKLYDNYDYIIHLASIIKHTLNNSEENIRININSTINLLELTKKIKLNNKKIRFILASTIGTVSCFENNLEYSNEYSEYSKRSINFPYYYSKIQMEKIALDYSDKYSIDLVIIRPPVIFGPNDPKGRATRLIKKFINNKIILYGSGNIPFCDVRDLCSLTYEIILHNSPKKIYNIDGTNWTMKKFYDVLESISNEDKIKLWIPYYLGYYGILILRNCFNLYDIIEIEMAHSYWNSKSCHKLINKWIDPEKTLLDTLKDIKSKL